MNYSGWLVPGWVPLAIVAGGIVWSVAIAMTGLPRRLARGAAEFWGGGALTRALTAASLYACACIAWGLILFDCSGLARTATPDSLEETDIVDRIRRWSQPSDRK